MNFATSHFGRKAATALARKGIRVIGLQALPDEHGSFLGPVAKFFRARFVRKLRFAEPISTQLWIEICPFRTPVHN